MRIIKEGSIEHKNTKEFECKNCGCKFECLEDEYWVDNSVCLTSYPAQYYIYSNCPTCYKICRSTKSDLSYKEYKVTLDGNTNTYFFGAKGKHEKKDNLSNITYAKDILVTPT